MLVYRIAKSKYAKDISGKGAERYGGRWNSKGRPILYTSDSRALAMAEVLAHIPHGLISVEFCIISIFLPDAAKIKNISEKNLETGWDNIPHGDSTQKIGDEFLIANKFLAMQVPSVIVKGDFNYLINPNHIDFKKVKIRTIKSFSFDDRLFRI